LRCHLRACRSKGTPVPRAARRSEPVGVGVSRSPYTSRLNGTLQAVSSASERGTTSAGPLSDIGYGIRPPVHFGLSSCARATSGPICSDPAAKRAKHSLLASWSLGPRRCKRGGGGVGGGGGGGGASQDSGKRGRARRETVGRFGDSLAVDRQSRDFPLRRGRRALLK